MASSFCKEDALKCLEVAKRAAEEGDLSKAEKFGQKAKKLCDCPEVTAFLKNLSSGTRPGPSSSSSGPTLRQRPPRTQEPKKPQGTPEQRALIARIKESKDFYETLDVTREATEDDIKRAYKKLALKLHPDKNRAAGAEEAFKAVSRAFACLSDPAKRQNYDRYGTEECVQNVQHPYRHEFYNDDFDPEQIFNMFFGGSFPMDGDEILRRSFHARRFRRTTHRPGTTHPNGTQSNAQMINLISLLPLLLFIFLSFFNGGNEELYSLYRESPYEQEMLTQNHGIAFYVKSKSKFGQHFPMGTRQRQALENNVEGVVKRILEENCREEKRKQRRIRSTHGVEAADHYELRSCFELKEKFYSGSKKGRTVKSH